MISPIDDQGRTDVSVEHSGDSIPIHPINPSETGGDGGGDSQPPQQSSKPGWSPGAKIVLGALLYFVLR